VETVVGKASHILKMYHLIVLGYTVVKVLRIYLFVEKNVKDRGRKLNIIEE